MVRVIVYSFACAMDIVLSAVLFVCMVRMAEMRASATAVAAFMPMWAAVYMVSSLLAGHVVTGRNAGWILIGTCAATVLLAGGYAVTSTTWVMYGLTALQGVATGFFFTPFQVFMKQVDAGKNKGICRSTGLYTFAWSSGYALGPFIAGLLWEHGGWRGCHLFNGVVAAAIAVGVLLLKHHAHVAAPATAEGETPETAADYSAMPDLAWMSWVFGGAGCFAVALIRSVFPTSGATLEISKPAQGTVLFVLSAVQALVGLALSRGRWWMYRPRPVLLFGLFGVAGLALFAAGHHPSVAAHATGVFSLAGACFGVYSGSFFFYFVFHSLVHPTRSGRYVSINEAVVGMTSIVGPFFGGWMADRFRPAAPYAAGLVLVLTAVAVQAAVHRSQRRGMNRAARLRPVP